MSSAGRWLALLTVVLAATTPVVAASPAAGAATTLQVGHLRVDYLSTPLTVDNPTPSLSWELDSTLADETQVAYQVQVASSTQLLESAPDLWDSGVVNSSASINVDYAGLVLKSRQSVWWRVRAWGAKGGMSDWSPVAHWEMGLLNASDWTARWIEAPASTVALPNFAKQFALGKAVSRARLYMTGLGVHDTTINGRAITNAVLQPGQTDYRKRVAYTSYDVTNLLAQGNNTLAVELGNGVANVPATDRYEKFSGTMSTPKLIAQLEVTHPDGTGTRVVSDASWRTRPGATTYSNWFGGEDYDARREQVDWKNPGADLSSWGAVVLTSAPGPGTVLSGQMTPPIQQIATRRPVKVTAHSEGRYVFDMGTLFSGWPKLTVRGAAGTRITIRPSELLRADGTSVQHNGSPFYNTYTLAGTGTEVWHMKFGYHAFRYIQLEGLPSAPTADTLVGLELSTVNPVVGSFDSGDGLVNSIHRIINQAVRNNFYSVPTDCPNREKLGWLEQDHLMFPSVARTYDLAAYYRHLMRNMADGQYPGGLVPDFVPQYVVYSGNWLDEPNWGSTFILSAWQLYETYGDVRTLRTYYGNLGRYLGHLQSRSSGHLLDYGVGDWAAVDRTTPRGVTASYAYYMSALTMARIAAVLGRTADVTTYTALARNIGNAFNAKYFDAAANTYAAGQQAADAMALDMGIVPAANRQRVLDHLVASIRAAGNHVSVGEIALPSLFRALQAGGRDDVIHAIATQTTAPSYGHMVNNGATALVEYWDQAGTRNSQSHFMLGAVDEWFHSGLGGLQAAPGTVAYKELVVAPVVAKGLSRAATTYRTPYGQAASSWVRSGNTVTYTIRIPVNTTATVRLPVNATNPTATPGNGFQGFQGGYAVYRTGSGAYTLTAVYDA